MLLSILFPLTFGWTAQTVAIEKTEHISDYSVACSCVAYARTRRPDIPSMDASLFVATTTTPYVGAIALMYYPRSGLYHLAYVEDVGDGYIVLSESNYVTCTIGTRRIELPHNRVIGYM